MKAGQRPPEDAETLIPLMKDTAKKAGASAEHVERMDQVSVLY
jgi:hypothetical protein